MAGQEIPMTFEGVMVDLVGRLKAGVKKTVIESGCELWDVSEIKLNGPAERTMASQAMNMVVDEVVKPDGLKMVRLTGGQPGKDKIIGMVTVLGITVQRAVICESNERESYEDFVRFCAEATTKRVTEAATREGDVALEVTRLVNLSVAVVNTGEGPNRLVGVPRSADKLFIQAVGPTVADTMAAIRVSIDGTDDEKAQQTKAGVIGGLHRAMS
jgi:hypothetical protein